MVIRARKNAPRRDDKAKASVAGAHKSTVALLRHLEPIRRKLTGLIDDISEPCAMQEVVEHYKGKLEQLEEATRAVETLLRTLAEPPIAPLPDGNPVRTVAQRVQEAWADANDGKVPRSRDPAGPLVSVVSDYLSLVGLDYGTENVSAILRDRRQAKSRTKSESKTVPRPE